MNYFYTNAQLGAIIPKDKKGRIDWEGAGFNIQDIIKYQVQGSYTIDGIETFISLLPISNQANFDNTLGGLIGTTGANGEYYQVITDDTYGQIKSTILQAVEDKKIDEIEAKTLAEALMTITAQSLGDPVDETELEIAMETYTKHQRLKAGEAPTEGANWSENIRYLKDEVVTGLVTGSKYKALKQSKNKPPEDNPSLWELLSDTPSYTNWDDIGDGTVIEKDTIVHYPTGGQLWKCSKQHVKSAVYEPKEGSSRWDAV